MTNEKFEKLEKLPPSYSYKSKMFELIAYYSNFAKGLA